MPPHGVALVSGDAELIADVRRLCAAAGQDVVVVTEGSDVRQLRRRFAMLLVDAAAPESTEVFAEPFHAAAGGVADVLVLTASPEAVDPWRTAVRVGARHVLSLPEDSRRLLDAVALAHESPDAAGPVIGVVGGSGGVGASTFAAAIAWAAATSGSRTTLVDLDPVGGGADLLLGLERAEGLRWADLSKARGVVPASVLHERLPRIDRLAVVSCGRLIGDVVPPAEIPVPAVTAVVAAARRGSGAVVVDLPRWRTDATDAVIGASDSVVVVVAAEVRGIAAAALTMSRAAALCDDINLVLRCRSQRRLAAVHVGECLDRPVMGTLVADQRLAAAVDRGELTAALPRSSVGSVAKDLWSRFAPLQGATVVGARGAAGP